eukprot:TRINITY_DN3411_c0_g1_i2.p1 TRINITY_DN3411_c0_g1~~TRINITY_DN3411_c0_g1_i2.p1  ORF type:complete len:121 (-),score=5.71 TRINITY_DN3411_c0_g1_i2:117-479(-)
MAVNTVDVEFTIKMNDCNPGSTIKRWDLPNGESFNTPTFSFAQKSAHVQIFPDGDRDENRGCVSVFLVFEPGDVQHDCCSCHRARTYRHINTSVWNNKSVGMGVVAVPDSCRLEATVCQA